MFRTVINSIILVLTVVLALCSCASSNLFSEKELSFSQKWLMASPSERGKLVDPSLLKNALYDCSKSEVIKFLGKPDIEETDYSLIYSIGFMNGPYEWSLRILFDEGGVVDEILVDD